MRYLAFLLMGLTSLSASALTTVNLYETEVVIDQTQNDADAKARSQGMQNVIVRATGDKDAANNEVIQKALSKYNQYLNQFSYGQTNDVSTITMQFSAPQIRSLITQAQLPFWPENRANLLVWLVEETPYERVISWEHSDSKILKQLKEESLARGLPITVPVGDFDDITGLEISDLWGGFIKPISLASDRYPTDAVLVVKAQGNDLRWTLYDQNAYNMLQSQKAPMTGRASGSTAAADMIDQISDYYAKKNSVLIGSESSQTVLASFDSIKNAEDFFSLEKRLKALSSVASLDILKIQGQEVVFNVHLLATEEDFEQEVLRIAQVKKAPEQEVSQPLPVEPSVEDGSPVQEPQDPALGTTEPAVVNSVDSGSSTQQGEMSVVTEPVPMLKTLRFTWLD
ncbi:DUF2066 domain-containing protein [Vibrio plantisponsor]|uniref:Uncharacterized protein n=2 Tax=Vibrio TaxID=662 RepID=A0A2J8GTH2_VIBDI|nr:MULTISPECIES: DUF2066 domain-containing protein [Vibrio]MDW6017789.1 DUF2066 domain-containing protein [Vibrio plantisponsor]NNM40622.1 DUF2066 domain-containing protein [Vibrio plantisponsor]PNH89313.1 DUF2066 domain-containing protein [Vibrio diazotrophicus]RAS57928.1 hypothetical protein DET48_13451 [Vibrio diazotrophicus]